MINGESSKDFMDEMKAKERARIKNKRTKAKYAKVSKDLMEQDTVEEDDKLGPRPHGHP